MIVGVFGLNGGAGVAEHWGRGCIYVLRWCRVLCLKAHTRGHLGEGKVWGWGPKGGGGLRENEEKRRPKGMEREKERGQNAFQKAEKTTYQLPLPPPFFLTLFGSTST